MRNYKNFNKIFVKGIGVSFQETKKFKNCNLKKRVLNSTDFVLSVMLLSNHFVNFSKLGDIINNIFDKVFIKTNDILEKSHCTKENSMVFLIKAGKYFWKKLGDIFWTFFNDSNSSKDSFLSNVCTVVRNALQYFVVKFPCKFSGTYFTYNTKDQSDNTVVLTG